MSKLIDRLILSYFKGILIGLGIAVLLFLFSGIDIVTLIIIGIFVAIFMFAFIAAAIIGGKRNHTQKQVENNAMWIILYITVPIIVVTLVTCIIFL